MSPPCLLLQAALVLTVNVSCAGNARFPEAFADQSSWPSQADAIVSSLQAAGYACHSLWYRHVFEARYHDVRLPDCQVCALVSLQCAEGSLT